MSDAAAIAAAAFGGAEMGAVDQTSDDESSAAGGNEDATERRIIAQKRAFPVRGVSCIGCSVDQAMVGKIDEFVKVNMHRLEPTAMWKTAALYWKQNVVDKAALESVEVPTWNWKDLRCVCSVSGG